ncbi:MAG: hypothetical protein ACR2FS_07760 [Phormidesmis sp.]
MLKLIRLLARLELGIFLFCDRKRAQAEAAGMSSLAEALQLQAAQELGHHGQLRRLAGDERYGKLKWAKTYAKAIREQAGEQAVDPDWCPEGISRRYLSARVWFAGQRACDLDWPDAIALMCVGEAAAAAFYRVLGWLSPMPYRAVFRRIASDEQGHQSELAEVLREMVGESASRWLWRWRWRGVCAIAVVPVDLAQMWLRWGRRRFGDRH